MLPQDVVFQLHCRNYINRHAISDEHYNRFVLATVCALCSEIGKGLYLDLCAYDHSCAPNVVFHCRGLAAVMRPLSPSVKLSDRAHTHYTYIDLLVAKQPRRKLLKDTWYFDCQCLRCADEMEHVLSAICCEYCQASVVVFGALAKKNMDTLQLSCTKCDAECSRPHVTQSLQFMRSLDQVIDGAEERTRQMADDLMATGERLLAVENVYLTKIYQLAISSE